jgi:hypothetical protein
MTDFKKALLDLKKVDGASITEIAIGTLLVLFTIFIIYTKTYHNGNKPTCDDYVYNTFLYVILGLLLLITFCMMNDKITILPDLFSIFIYSGGSLIAILILSIIMIGILIFFMYMTKHTDPTNTVLIHLYWTGFIYTLASLFYLIYLISRNLGIFKTGIIITFIIVIITCFVAIKYPDLLPQSLRYWLIGGLVVNIIVAYGALFLIKDPVIFEYVIIAVTCVSLIIFVLFLILEVSKITENAKTCVVPNYPGESLNIIYDVYAILTNILRLLMSRRGSRR